jgi:hypothetical protein
MHDTLNALPETLNGSCMEAGLGRIATFMLANPSVRA